ncbi:MAG: SsrA-binding protein SmpB [Chitinophagales bacterium]|nr:SsrA-binding protein SmpB [Chitinophagales bacterium]
MATREKNTNLSPETVNRKAKFNFELIESFDAGLMLTGTEVKALREGKVSMVDSFCYFLRGELYAKNLHIGEYKHGNIYNHEPMRVRKLLLNKRELKKLALKVKEKGLTIVPYRIFFNDRGYAKVEICLARGKKSFDKRETLKERDTQMMIKQVMNRRS